MKFANPGPGAGGAWAQVLEMHGDAQALVHCAGPGAGGARELVGSLQHELHTDSTV